MVNNGMRPVHPGEVLREDFLAELGMGAGVLAKVLNVPTSRINAIVRERRGISADTGPPFGALFRRQRTKLAEPAIHVRPACGRDRRRQADRTRSAGEGCLGCCGLGSATLVRLRTR